MPVRCPVCQAVVQVAYFPAHTVTFECRLAGLRGSPEPPAKRPRLHGPGEESSGHKACQTEPCTERPRLQKAAQTEQRSGDGVRAQGSQTETAERKDCQTETWMCVEPKACQAGCETLGESRASQTELLESVELKAARAEGNTRATTRAAAILSLETVSRRLFAALGSTAELRSALMASRPLAAALHPHRRTRRLRACLDRASAPPGCSNHLSHKVRMLILLDRLPELSNLRSLTLSGKFDLRDLFSTVPKLRLRHLCVKTSGLYNQDVFQVPKAGERSPLEGIQSLQMGLGVSRAQMADLCRLLPSSLHCLRLDEALGSGQQRDNTWNKRYGDELCSFVERAPRLHFLQLTCRASWKRFQMAARCGERPFFRYLDYPDMVPLDLFVQTQRDPVLGLRPGFRSQLVRHLGGLKEYHGKPPPADIRTPLLSAAAPSFASLESLRLKLLLHGTGNGALEALTAMPRLRSLRLVLFDELPMGQGHTSRLADWLGRWDLLKRLQLTSLRLSIVTQRTHVCRPLFHLPRTLRRLSLNIDIFGLFVDGEAAYKASAGKPRGLAPVLEDEVLVGLVDLHLGHRLFGLLEGAALPRLARLSWSARRGQRWVKESIPGCEVSSFDFDAYWAKQRDAFVPQDRPAYP